MKDNKTGLYYVKVKLDIEEILDIFGAQPFKEAFLEACRYARTGDEPDENSLDKDVLFMWRTLKPMVDDSFDSHSSYVERGRAGGITKARNSQAKLSQAEVSQAKLSQAEVSQAKLSQAELSSIAENSRAENSRAENSRAENSIKDYSAQAEPQTSVYERIRPNTTEEPAPALSTLKEICNKGHIKLSAADLEAIRAELAGQGWTFGGEPIRNLSKVLRWYERNPEEIRKTRKQPKRSFSDQRVYEYDELEKKLYSAGMAPDPVPEGSNE